jgi:hypothetical protein
MPRGRAVRVVGVSLAASIVPGVRSRVARAAPAQVTCRGDRRTCQKGAEASFEKYCCPSPSWRWFCGGQDNGYRCINQCPSGGKTFPCTAAIAHPESGINGVCCDRRLHSGCVPVGPAAEKRPDGSLVPSQTWKPSCCPKGAGFGFCNDTCCQAPNRCRSGKCRCPNGAESCDGRKCCKAGEKCAQCYRFRTNFVSSPTGDQGIDIVGRKCCPKQTSCCGETCCKEFGCCGTKCCPHPKSRCTRVGAKDVCCPSARATAAAGHWRCCPAGTVASEGISGCCPPGDPTCCGGVGVPAVNCGTKLCVRGACVNP